MRLENELLAEVCDVCRRNVGEGSGRTELDIDHVALVARRQSSGESHRYPVVASYSHHPHRTSQDVAESLRRQEEASPVLAAKSILSSRQIVTFVCREHGSTVSGARIPLIGWSGGSLMEGMLCVTVRGRVEWNLDIVDILFHFGARVNAIWTLNEPLRHRNVRVCGMGEKSISSASDAVRELESRLRILNLDNPQLTFNETVANRGQFMGMEWRILRQPDHWPEDARWPGKDLQRLGICDREDGRWLVPLLWGSALAAHVTARPQLSTAATGHDQWAERSRLVGNIQALWVDMLFRTWNDGRCPLFGRVNLTSSGMNDSHGASLSLWRVTSLGVNEQPQRLRTLPAVSAKDVLEEVRQSNRC